MGARTPHPPLFSRDEASEEVPESLGDVDRQLGQRLDHVCSGVRPERHEEDQEGNASVGQKLLPGHTDSP